MNNIKTLTVYLGSSGFSRPVFQNSAVELGRFIATHGYKLVYGGMDAGLMGLLAKSVLENGGEVTGIIPQKLKDSERILPGLTETVLVEDLWDRKKRMFNLADAVLALPGGFGTLDESLEILYWAHLKLHNKPLVLINIDNYWDDLIQFLHAQDDFDERFLIVAKTLDDIEPMLKKWDYPLVIPPNVPHHFPNFEGEIKRVTKEPILIDKPSVENAYYAVCALGLKQLDKHERAIGFLNKDNQFDGLLKWFERAEKETFITLHCLQLFDVAKNIDVLRQKLAVQAPVHIDLHSEKWGKPVS